MKNVMKLGLLPMIALLIMGVASAERICMAAVLEGGQQVPAVATPAVGSGHFIIDTDANTLEYDIVYDDLSSAETASAIHGPAARGNEASSLWSLPGGANKEGVVSISEEQQGHLVAGHTYVNVASAGFSDGELRGQIDTRVSCHVPSGEVPEFGVIGAGLVLAVAGIFVAAKRKSF